MEEEFYNEYIKPVVFFGKKPLDALLLSKCLRNDGLYEISSLIEADYRTLGIANDIASLA